MNGRFFGQQMKRKPHDASKRMGYRPSASRSISQPSPVLLMIQLRALVLKPELETGKNPGVLCSSCVVES